MVWKLAIGYGGGQAPPTLMPAGLISRGGDSAMKREHRSYVPLFA